MDVVTSDQLTKVRIFLFLTGLNYEKGVRLPYLTRALADVNPNRDPYSFWPAVTRCR